MFRRAFRKIGRISGINSAVLAVSPFLFSASLLTSTATGSPLITAQASPPNPAEDFSVQSLVADMARTDSREFQSRSAFWAPSFAFVSSTGGMSAQSVPRRFASAPEEQLYECYPYLLLTLGLILLAFRPASLTAGRP